MIREFLQTLLYVLNLSLGFISEIPLKKMQSITSAMEDGANYVKLTTLDTLTSFAVLLT